MEQFRPVRGIGIAASVLVGLVALGQIGSAFADWFTYTTVRDYRAGAATRADLTTVDQVNALVGLPLTLLLLVAGVVFMIWTYNARINAERLTPANEHRRSRVWVWLGWIVPIVNLWFPKQIIDDIWRASDPQQQVAPLQQRVQHTKTTRWWIAFILMCLFDNAYLRFYEDGALTTDSFLAAAILSTLSAFVGIIAAVLAAQVVQRISDFQSTPLVPENYQLPTW